MNSNHLTAWLAAALTCTCAPAAAAQLDRVSARVTGSAALMLSSDQVERMQYDQAGMLANVSLGYELLPWLDAQLGLRGGGFLSNAPTGGLLAPSAGARLHSPARRMTPYLCLDAGAAVTGELTRPLIAVSGGLDIAAGRRVALGPAIGVDSVVQWNGAGDSTNAVFAWIGLSLRYRSPEPEPPRPRPPAPRIAAAPPAAATAESLPNEELTLLIEHSLAPARVELLAPVLFGFDSARLEPIGVAMLHEVAHTLRERPDIRLLEIEGYADRRGGSDYNRALSRARAERVRSWLEAHGVAPERLRVAAHGADALLEAGGDERAHQQNRRVVFRVIELAAP